MRARIVTVGLISWLLVPQEARAVDEIQVYNAGIAAPGQFRIEQHLNYVGLGRAVPPFPGGLVSNRSINGTPEFAYGITDWWEVGFYLPFAIQDQNLYSDAFKLRTLLVSPHADQSNLFYGVNFEFSNSTLKFSQARFGFEVRPIIGVRNAHFEFIVNPIVDFGFGKYGEANFAPAARLARTIANDTLIGLEYYGDFGEVGHFGSISEQQHTLFAVTDFKLNDIDVNLGVGYGLTQASDRLVVKMMLGYAFPAPGAQASTAVPLPFRPNSFRDRQRSSPFP